VKQKTASGGSSSASSVHRPGAVGPVQALDRHLEQRIRAVPGPLERRPVPGHALQRGLVGQVRLQADRGDPPPPVSSRCDVAVVAAATLSTPTWSSPSP
jgi:hypothetical protein